MSQEMTHNEQHGNAVMTQQVDEKTFGPIYVVDYMRGRHLRQNQHTWMIDGRTMTFRDFLDEIAPGDDNPQRTFLTLKYGGWNESN